MSAENPTVWGTEDGDVWCCDGPHQTLEQMAKLVEDLEVECVGRTEYDEEYRAVVETGSISHVWFREDPNDDERIDIAGEARDGYRPLTMLYAGTGIIEDPDQMELPSTP